MYLYSVLQKLRLLDGLEIKLMGSVNIVTRQVRQIRQISQTAGHQCPNVIGHCDSPTLSSMDISNDKNAISTTKTCSKPTHTCHLITNVIVIHLGLS